MVKQVENIDTSNILDFLILTSKVYPHKKYDFMQQHYIYYPLRLFKNSLIELLSL